MKTLYGVRLKAPPSPQCTPIPLRGVRPWGVYLSSPAWSSLIEPSLFFSGHVGSGKLRPAIYPARTKVADLRRAIGVDTLGHVRRDHLIHDFVTHAQPVDDHQPVRARLADLLRGPRHHAAVVLAHHVSLRGLGASLTRLKLRSLAGTLL